IRINRTSPTTHITSRRFHLIFWRLAYSTLFPYTTLFRSYSGVCRIAGLYLVAGAGLGGAGWHRRARLVERHQPVAGAGCRRDRRDRKSTRLNSSHVKISYAVFCLKKKKTHEHLLRMPRRG